MLLVRGKESILISPNSVIGVPRDNKGNLTSTILQQAGSILLEVEERNVKHFEVETPYLAAVVKGTQFRVTVAEFGSRVEVLRGKVEVSDFKSGQFALVLPGQAARVSAQGNGGLSLSGGGKLNPIEKGTPRPSSLTRVAVPKSGLTAPQSVSKESVRALAGSSQVALSGAPGLRSEISSSANPLRITSTIGDVKLDFQNITKGLVRTADPSNPGQLKKAEKALDKTVWSANSLVPGNGAAKTFSVSVGNGNASGQGSSGGGGGGGSGGNSNAGGNGNGNAFGLTNTAANAVAAVNGVVHGLGKGKGKGKN